MTVAPECFLWETGLVKDEPKKQRGLKSSASDDVPSGDEVQDLLRRVDALPETDSRTEDEILDYDENGIPR